MSSAGHLGRRADPDRDLPGRHRRRSGAGAGAEPGQPGVAPTARGGPAARRHHGEELAQLHHGGAPGLAGQPLRRRVSPELRAPADQGRDRPHSRRGPGAGLRGRRLRHAGVAGSGQGRVARPHRQRRGERHPRAERPGRGRRGRRPADARRRSTTSSASTRAAACSTRRNSARSSSRPARMARPPASATWPGSSSPPATTRSAPCSTTRTRSASASSRRRARTRCSSRPPSARPWRN